MTNQEAGTPDLAVEAVRPATTHLNAKQVFAAGPVPNADAGTGNIMLAQALVSLSSAKVEPREQIKQWLEEADRGPTASDLSNEGKIESARTLEPGEKDTLIFQHKRQKLDKDRTGSDHSNCSMSGSGSWAIRRERQREDLVGVGVWSADCESVTQAR